MKMVPANFTKTSECIRKYYDELKPQVLEIKSTDEVEGLNPIFLCMIELTDLYLKIKDNNGWQDVISDREWNLSFPFCHSYTNLSIFNSEIDFLIQKYEEIFPSHRRTKDQEDMIKNLSILKLVTKDTPCALSVLDEAPGYPFSREEQYRQEYRLADKAYVRLDNVSSPLLYLNLKTATPPKNVEIPVDEKKSLNQALEKFDEAVNIPFLKTQSIRGKLLSRQDLNDLATALGKDNPERGTRITQLTDFDIDDANCLERCWGRKMCTIL